ncbi:MAG: hypothetical protein V1698_01045 [bacterium]
MNKKYSSEEIAAMEARLIESTQSLSLSFFKKEFIVQGIEKCLEGNELFLPRPFQDMDDEFEEKCKFFPTEEIMEKSEEIFNHFFHDQIPYSIIGEKARNVLFAKKDIALTRNILDELIKIFEICLSQRNEQGMRFMLLSAIAKIIAQDSFNYARDTLAKEFISKLFELRDKFIAPFSDDFLLDNVILSNLGKKLLKTFPDFAFAEYMARYYLDKGVFPFSYEFARFIDDSNFYRELGEKSFKFKYKGFYRSVGLVCSLKCAYQIADFEWLKKMAREHFNLLLQGKATICQGAAVTLFELMSPHDPQFLVEIVEKIKDYSLLLQEKIAQTKRTWYFARQEELDIEQSFLKGIRFLAYEIYRLKNEIKSEEKE